MSRSIKFGVVGAIVSAVVVVTFAYAFADAATLDFEGYALGTVNGQDGWSSFGAAGLGCAIYDHAVSSSFGVPGFGSKSLRISNAVTSGCFGDQTFTKSLVDEAGETIAINDGMSGGARQTHFEAEFEIRSMQLSQQPGLFISVSPDRGDGARMSYLGFRDDPDGIRVNFYDVQGTSSPANFVETVLATGLSRAVTHTAKFEIDFVDGPSNDIVKIYIDGSLVHTGTTWENYFRYDPESNPDLSDESRTVDSLLFRTGGTAAPATAGLGYLIDNVSLASSSPTPPAPVTVTIVKYVDGVHATAGNAQSLSFPMNATWGNAGFPDGSGSFALSPVGFNNPNPYEATTADMSVGANYSTYEDTTGSTVGSNCAAGKPFALLGYSTGTSEANAAGNPLSTTTPSLTGIATSTYIIVWNQTCTTTLTVTKIVVNDNGGVATTSDFTLFIDGATTTSGVATTVAPGSHVVSEGSHAGYTATFSGDCDAGGNVSVGAGQHKQCTITNNDIAIVPPPPVNACATPGSAPSGYILQTGTVGNDNVTIAPFTMFVGLNGNDIVNGPAAGNYIVCTGAGSDTITLGNGDFTINAGNGNNVVTTGNGNGTITAGPATDKITTGDGAQTINAGNGNNTVQTGNGNKIVTGGPANDKVTTGNGSDSINVGGGINTVHSGAGDDTVVAGPSNDTIDGGLGTDSCNAGGGINSVTNCEI